MIFTCISLSAVSDRKPLTIINDIDVLHKLRMGGIFVALHVVKYYKTKADKAMKKLTIILAVILFAAMATTPAIAQRGWRGMGLSTDAISPMHPVST